MKLTLSLTVRGVVWLLGLSLGADGRVAVGAGVRALGHQWAGGMELSEAGVTTVTHFTALEVVAAP